MQPWPEFVKHCQANPPQVLVVGAGLTGLTAAYRLQQAGVTVAIVEASDSVGGVIQSEWLANDQGQRFLVENGPHTFQPSGQALLALCDELGLTLQRSDPLAKNRFVWWKSQLCPVPMSPWAFITSPLLSLWGKIRLLLEPCCSPSQGEPTVAEWVRHRLGPEALTTLVGPFLSGVYAGDPQQLSAPGVFRRLVAWERSAGSVLRGALAQAWAKKTTKTASEPLKTEKQPYGLLNFSGGMATLPHALAAQLPGLTTGVAVTHVTQTMANTWQVTFATGETLTVPAVVLAVPASVAAQLLAAIPDSEPASTALAAMPYAPMVVVHVALPKSSVQNALAGFGVLVPRASKTRLLGSIWTSTLFPGRCPGDQHLLTVFIGGATDVSAIELSDEALQTLILSELTPILGLQPNIQPTMFHVQRWPQAIPQYTVGHVSRLETLSVWQAAHPTLQLAGNYMTGVALNDCVLQGNAVAERVAAVLAPQAVAMAKYPA